VFGGYYKMEVTRDYPRLPEITRDWLLQDGGDDARGCYKVRAVNGVSSHPQL